jgi:hypothetical protein
MKRVPAVSCPTCQAEVPWSETSLWRPFCSSRCRGIDLGEWASDRFVIAGNDPADLAGEAPSTASGLRQ